MVDPLDSITHLLTFDYAREREIKKDIEPRGSRE